MTDAVYSNGDTVTFANGDVATFGHASEAHTDTNDRVVITPSPRLPAGKKPTGPVTIDWDHPFTDGLVRCFLPTPGNYKDLVGGYGTITGGSFGSDEGGNFYQPADNDKYIDTGYYPHNQSSVMAVAKRGSSSTRQLFGVNDGSNHRLYFGHRDDGNYQFGWGDGNSTSVNINSTLDPVGGVNVYSLDPYLSGNGANLYVNGGLVASSALWSFSGTSTEAFAIGFNTIATDAWDYPVYFCCLWDHQLDNYIRVSLARDPYQFLKPAVPETQIITTPATADDRVWII